MNFTFKICFLKVVGQFLGNWIPPLLFSDSTSEALLSCIVSFSLFSKSIPSVIQTQLVSSIKKNPFFIPWCLLLTTPQFSIHFTLSLFKSVFYTHHLQSFISQIFFNPLQSGFCSPPSINLLFSRWSLTSMGQIHRPLPYPYLTGPLSSTGLIGSILAPVTLHSLDLPPAS